MQKWKILSISVGLFLLLTGCSPDIETITEYVEVEKPVTKYVIVEKPIYIERIVEVETIKEVEIIVEVPIELRDFESVEELREWLTKECTFTLSGKDIDCDNYALELQQRGLKDGYLLNFEAILPDEYNKLFKKLKIDGLHAMNSAIIGNTFYYIEPQTREIAWGGFLD